MKFVNVAQASQLAPGKAIRVEIGDEPIAIFNVDGDLYAIGDTCSHEEASLSEGDVFGTCVECPLHGAEFDLKTGRPRTLPAVTPVPTYAVKVEDGAIMVSAEPQ